MRYTTILDLRDWPLIYRNQNARLLYMHLVLISGYHDYNRDFANISIRRLADDVGLSVSATRHALGLLDRAKIIQRHGTGWLVRKYLKEQPISKRETKRVGVVQQPQEPGEASPRKTSLQQLQERAAAGDKRAEELIKKYFTK